MKKKRAIFKLGGLYCDPILCLEMKLRLKAQGEGEFTFPILPQIKACVLSLY